MAARQRQAGVHSPSMATIAISTVTQLSSAVKERNIQVLAFLLTESFGSWVPTLTAISFSWERPFTGLSTMDLTSAIRPLVEPSYGPKFKRRKVLLSLLPAHRS